MIGTIIDAEPLDLLIEIMKSYQLDKQIVLNGLRILSKLSLNTKFGDFFFKEPSKCEIMLQLMENFKTNNYVVMRTSFILANLTTFHETISSQLYFNLNGFDKIFACFSGFISKAKHKDDFYDSMLKSFTSFDFL